MAKRIEPDRAALEIAHRKLATKAPLEQMLASPQLRATLYALARRHMRDRARFDPKRHQANDAD